MNVQLQILSEAIFLMDIIYEDFVYVTSGTFP